MREFKGGSVRDSDSGKIKYIEFRNPLVEHSFGKYMLKHQKRADGKIRRGDNWWAGWDTHISLDSMARHLADLECLHAGLFVYKHRDKYGEETIVLPNKVNNKGWEEVTESDALNAIKFNCNAYLLKILRVEPHKAHRRTITKKTTIMSSK